VVLGIHLHAAGGRDEAIENGALALSSQAEVFLRGRLSRSVQTEQIQTYATKSASREAFEKLHTPEKARAAVAEEGTSIMAVWGTPEDCIEKLRFYVDSIHPEQLMLNIASGSLPQKQVCSRCGCSLKPRCPLYGHYKSGPPDLVFSVAFHRTFAHSRCGPMGRPAKFDLFFNCGNCGAARRTHGIRTIRHDGV
jgi:hypothetical protein